MNNNKKSHKSSSLSPPTKIKIITNGNGMSTISVNGKVRGRSSKPSTSTSDALDVFTFVSEYFEYILRKQNTDRLFNFSRILATEWSETNQR